MHWHYTLINHNKEKYGIYKLYSKWILVNVPKSSFLPSVLCPDFPGDTKNVLFSLLSSPNQSYNEKVQTLLKTFPEKVS